jgi:hypothetical protein
MYSDSNPLHVLQISVVSNMKPAILSPKLTYLNGHTSYAWLPHGYQPCVELSPHAIDTASLLSQFKAYNDHLFAGKQSAYLADNCHMYLLPNGRINIGSLNRSNLDRFAQAVHEAIINVPDDETSAPLNTE